MHSTAARVVPVCKQRNISMDRRDGRDRQTEGQNDEQTGRQTDRRTDRQTDRHRKMSTGRQIDRQTDTCRQTNK